MKCLLPLLFAAAAAFPQIGLAQQYSPVPVVSPGNSVLTLTAEGRSFRSPDVAVFQAGVSTTGKTAAEALSANSAAMERVIAQLRRAGIADRDIQTSNLNVEPVYSDPNRDAAMAARFSGQPYVPPPPEASLPKIVGYRTNNSVSVRQRDLKNFGRIIDTLVEAGANQVNGPSFTIDQPDPALDEARTAAIRQARQRAQLYASAAGLKIVRILSITEGGAGYYGPQPVYATAMSSMTPPAPPPPPPAPVQPGEVQMTVNLTVLYELAPAGA